MRCSRCHRPLKSGTIGPVCARLGARTLLSASSPPPVRIYLLGHRRDGTRSYVVFDSGAEFRVTIGHRAKCWTCGSPRCGHVEKVKAKEAQAI